MNKQIKGQSECRPTGKQKWANGCMAALLSGRKASLSSLFNKADSVCVCVCVCVSVYSSVCVHGARLFTSVSVRARVGSPELFTLKIPLNWYQVFKRGQMLPRGFMQFPF